MLSGLAFALACVSEFPPPQGGGSSQTDGTSSSSTAATVTGDPASTDPSVSSSDGGDTSGPVPVCGNGLLEMGEICDTGPDNGIGACKDDCSPNYCGDGYLGPGELCDDGNLVDGDDCTSNCTNPNCGNMNVEPPEECDDGNGNDDDDCLATCVSASCGDQHVHATAEVCDGTNVGATACEDIGGFEGGVLVCNADCSDFDTSGCWLCGDGEIDPGEDCDTSLGGQTCVSLGFGGGMLECSGTCQFDTSMCCEGDGGFCDASLDCCSMFCNFVENECM